MSAQNLKPIDVVSLEFGKDGLYEAKISGYTCCFIYDGHWRSFRLYKGGIRGINVPGAVIIKDKKASVFEFSKDIDEETWNLLKEMAGEPKETPGQLQHVLAEVKWAVEQLDALAVLRGDEEAFARCRNRLRTLIA